MLTKLQEWVAGYYERYDAWSYRAHREIFDTFTGPKIEHREAATYAIRFHLAPGVEAMITADGMGALLRSAGAPPWNFRCRGAMLQLEESLFIDGHGKPVSTLQLVVVGETSAIGSEIAWQFRRSS